MSYFAEISGSSNIVIRVIVAEQDFIDSGAVGSGSNWVKTSKEENYAGIGYTYDKDSKIFSPPLYAEPSGSFVSAESIE